MARVQPNIAYIELRRVRANDQGQGTPKPKVGVADWGREEGRRGDEESGSGGGDGLGVGAWEAIGEGRRLGINREGRKGGEKEEKLDKNIILLIFINFILLGPIWSQTQPSPL